MIVTLVLFTVAACMLAESRLSARHERHLRRAGASEPEGDPFALMRIAYPGAFVLMGIEGLWAGVNRLEWLFAGGVIFVVAKALKYWAIASLGERWTFRVLVLPAQPLVQAGPYRFMRHPNYVAVCGELVGIALMLDARITGPLAVLGFGWLLLWRVRVEERALGLR